MPGPGDILITVGAKTADAVRELGQLHGALDDTASRSQKMGAALSKAALPAAAALAGIGAAAVHAGKAAAEDAALQAHLAASLKATANATDAQVAAMGDYIDKTELATGVSDEKLSPALETLTRATGNLTESQKLMSVALDVSAATGKDVETVANAMAKAHEGQTTALARLVPGLDEATRKSKDFDVVLAGVAKTTSGAMAASAGTAEGQMRRFAASTDQLNEALGNVLLPIMNAVLPLLTRLAGFAKDNATAIQVLAGVVATLAAGILAANVALKAYEAAQVAIKVATAAWTAAQWLLNAALDANPIGAVVLALTALAAGLVVAYKHSQTFRDVVHAALGAVETAARAVGDAFSFLVGAAKAAFDWIVSHWQLALLGLPGIGEALYLIATNWDKVAAAATAAYNTVKGVIDGIVGAIESAINAIERLIDALSHIHVPSIHLPDLNPFSLAAPLAATGRSAAEIPTSRSSRSSGVVVNVYGAIDPEGTARAIRRILNGSDRRMGRRPLT